MLGFYEQRLRAIYSLLKGESNATPRWWQQSDHSNATDGQHLQRDRYETPTPVEASIFQHRNRKQHHLH